MSAPSNKAIIIGGSLGGLFAGTMIRRTGWKAVIFERSPHDLDSRGGGIVLQPDVVRVFKHLDMYFSQNELGVPSRYRRTFRPDGKVKSEQMAPQMQTSWSLIYSAMKEAFGDEHYHQGRTLVDIRQDETGKTVTAIFEDGSQETGDLLIGADGNGSTVRQLLWPEDHPSYAGYLAWRGLVPESEIPPEAAQGLVGDFGFANTHGSHMLGYLVPGENNDLREGYRFYNWVWYRVTDDVELARIMTDRDGKPRGFSMPEGKLSEDWKAHVYDEADEFLPPNFRAMVKATKEPFAQAIRDLTVRQMVKGRVVLLGDAAFIPRPHTAASTSKAASNALSLADALIHHPDDTDAALKAWEPQQIAIGNALYRQGTRTGNYLMFHQEAFTPL